MAPRTIRLLLVRHGETADNARQVIQGHIDTPLNENGIIQAEITRDSLADCQVDICYTSDLQRASKTAEIIMEKHPGAPLVIDNRIKEKYLGKLEGTIYYTAHTPEAMATIEPANVFVGRLLDFFDALFTSLRVPSTINGRHPGSNGYNHVPSFGLQGSILPSEILHKEVVTILVVSHGGPVKVLLPALAKSRGVEWAEGVQERAQALKHKVWNCSISEVELSPANDGSDQWKGLITRFVDVSHFERANENLVHEGTEADSAMSAQVEQAKEWI